ncbi:MAG: glycosyltransferase family 39 protein [Pirellulales bacterium]|nr:glycosyltransferase family 39 protein [Pirellulales bacterium]
MDLWDILRRHPAEHFPARLTAEAVLGKDAAAALPRRWSLLAFLLLFCLVFRVWSAWKWNVLWADSIAYLADADALARGDLQRAFGAHGLNVYPVILLWLQRTGGNVLVTAEWWSVLMGTLTVLPLFGWIRRQFDDQVATVACLLYAFHPKLVVFCPLIIRDATLWFLFTLSIYLFWRAITENRWWLFLVAGIALTLNVHTRTEGWLLLPSLLLWCAIRVFAVPRSRIRVIFGTAVCLSVIPASITLVNMTWLRECPQWQIVRSDHLKIVDQWLKSFHSPDQTPKQEPPKQKQPSAVAKTNPKVAKPSPPPKAAKADLKPSRDRTPAHPAGPVLMRKVVMRLVKAFTYVHGLLTLVGLFLWRRVWIRLEQQALALMGLLLVVAVYVNYTSAGIDVRYFLPLVLVSFPWMALGFLSIERTLLWASRRTVAWNANRRGVLVISLLVIALVLSAFNTKASADSFMHRQAALGKWIASRFGTGKTLMACVQDSRPVTYYSQGGLSRELAASQFADGTALALVRSRRPQIIVIDSNRQNGESWITFQNTLVHEAERPYRRIPANQLPPECRGIVVLVRDGLD